MCVAIRTAQWENVAGLGNLVGLLEFSYIALLVWLGTDGPGPLSLDRLIGRVAQRGDADRRHTGGAPVGVSDRPRQRLRAKDASLNRLACSGRSTVRSGPSENTLSAMMSWVVRPVA